jgi:hypothetical protein
MSILSAFRKRWKMFSAFSIQRKGDISQILLQLLRPTINIPVGKNRIPEKMNLEYLGGGYGTNLAKLLSVRLQ